MSWMMVVAVAWLFWMYEYIPGMPVTVLLGFHGPRRRRRSERLHPARLRRPRHGHQSLTDVFGAFFAQVYLAIERALIWIAVGWRRVAMGIALVTLLSFGSLLPASAENR